MTQNRGIKRIQKPRNGIQYVVHPETREELKPIVFFDAGSFTKTDDELKIGFHPHSGIGIVTYFHGTDLHHRDSGHNDGIIYDGGAQWIRSGGGVWHEEAYRRKHDAPACPWTGSIHQLWLQLPPEYEESEVEYANLKKEEIPSVDGVKVLIGEYRGVRGKMHVPLNMTYLDLSLEEGQTWTFDTPTGQTSGFIFPRTGAVASHRTQLGNALMGILEHNDGRISVTATSAESSFVLVLTEPSRWPIVSSGSQIHTNREALDRSARRIQDIGKTL